jgi:branched-chain amino acid transport system substrate-binding protein
MSQITRRTAVAGAALLAAPAVLKYRAQAAGKPVKLGLVAPRSGPLAAFAEADPFVLDQVQKAIGPGLTIAGEQRPVQIVARDSQSNPSRAAEVAADLILGEKVDLLLAASTPDTTNPVADQAEVNEIPCITTDCPWQPYFFGRKGDPKQGFEWTYHFFWGLEDVIAAFVAMWDTAQTNKIVGGLFPNDADGNAWGDAAFGFPGVLPKSGYKVIDTGHFQPGANDFTAQISAFKQAGCDIITGNLTPPDFATFWTQAQQQGLRPKIVTIGKALLFPSALAAIGPSGDGLSTEIWWTPHHPFKSGLTGQSAAELCDAYTKATGRPWTQPLGYKHALLEVALDVLKRTKKIEPQAILDAIRATDYRSIIGPVKWTGQPNKNVAKTPLVAGQWRRQASGFELAVAENKTAPEIPIGAPLQMLRH